MGQSSSKGVEHATSHEDEASRNWLAYFRKAVSEYHDEEQKRVAEWLLKSKTSHDMVARVSTLMRGSWKNDVALGGSAIAGLSLGHLAGSLLPASLGPIPYVALLGLGGLLPGLLTRQSQIARSVFQLGGLMFGAGAFLGARR